MNKNQYLQKISKRKMKERGPEKYNKNNEHKNKLNHNKKEPDDHGMLQTKTTNIKINSIIIKEPEICGLLGVSSCWVLPWSA